MLNIALCFVIQAKFIGKANITTGNTGKYRADVYGFNTFLHITHSWKVLKTWEKNNTRFKLRQTDLAYWSGEIWWIKTQSWLKSCITLIILVFIFLHCLLFYCPTSKTEVNIEASLKCQWKYYFSLESYSMTNSLYYSFYFGRGKSCLIRMITALLLQCLY